MIVNSILVGLRGQAAVQAEVIALRHQLSVVQRTQAASARAESDRPLPLGLAIMIVVGMAFRADHR
jgi:hypothetical protein